MHVMVVIRQFVLIGRNAPIRRTLPKDIRCILSQISRELVEKGQLCNIGLKRPISYICDIKT